MRERRRFRPKFKGQGRGAGAPPSHDRRQFRSIDGPAILFGWHTATAALNNPARRIRRLLATENAARRLAEESIKPAVTPEIVRPDAIARLLSADAVHQGLYAEVDPLPSPSIETL